MPPYLKNDPQNVTYMAGSTNLIFLPERIDPEAGPVEVILTSIISNPFISYTDGKFLV